MAFSGFVAAGAAHMHEASSLEEAGRPVLLEVCFTTYEKRVNLPLISVHG